MPPELIPEDEDYASEEDSDFAPDAAPAKEDADTSDDEAEPEEVKAPKFSKRKRAPDDDAEDAGFENSGDEAIIEKGLKRQKKRSKKGKDEEEDEGGEGGLVKTRSMRAAAKTEKKVALVDSSKSTVDVDALWASMTTNKPSSSHANPVTTTTSSPSKSVSPTVKRTNLAIPDSERKGTRSPSILNDGPDAMILIKRSYTFAGKIHHEQKLVPRHSAEAKLFLASQTSIPSPTTDTSPDPFVKPKRPPKKARRSIFEPVVDLPPRTDLKLGFRKLQEGLGNLDVGEKGKKLNTVEKSKMDWAGYVDKEGIAEELDQAGKRKGGFKERQEFIARTQFRQEEDDRRARGVVSLSGGL